MITERKVCMSCLLVSNYHKAVCKRCGYSELSSIDDYFDQSCLNGENRQVLDKVLELANEIRSDVESFDKYWFKVWDSEIDMDFEMISEMEQKDWSYVLNE